MIGAPSECRISPPVLCRVIISLLIGVFLSGCTGQSEKEDPMRIMSYNIRYDNPGDGPNQWQHRKDRLVNLVKYHSPDILGTQEGLLHQLEWLDDELTGYDRIGVGRNDGAEEGEFTAIYYNSERLELVEGSDSTIWLSTTPGEPSKDWDAALPRIVTWGTFRDRENGQELVVFNTHFDHIGEQARTESARIIVDKVDEIAGDLPAVVTGDFNMTPDSEAYSVMASALSDGFETSLLPHVGPEFTFEGFAVAGGEEGRRIDYIFANSAVTVQTHAILSTYRDGFYPSDHLPVVAGVTF